MYIRASEWQVTKLTEKQPPVRLNSAKHQISSFQKRLVSGICCSSMETRFNGTNDSDSLRPRPDFVRAHLCELQLIYKINPK